MKRSIEIVTIVISLMIAICSSVNVHAAAAVQHDTDDEQQILTVINEKRMAAGLKPLTYSSQLYADATVRAQEAAVKFGHTRPNGQAWYTVDTANMYGECLAAQEIIGSKDAIYGPSVVVQDWVNSPSHYAIMMAADYNIGAIAQIYVNGQWITVLETGY